MSHQSEILRLHDKFFFFKSSADTCSRHEVLISITLTQPIADQIRVAMRVPVTRVNRSIARCTGCNEALHAACRARGTRKQGTRLAPDSLLHNLGIDLGRNQFPFPSSLSDVFAACFDSIRENSPAGLRSHFSSTRQTKGKRQKLHNETLE